jgi:hypothetical protein
MKGSMRSLPSAVTPEGVNVHEADWGMFTFPFNLIKGRSM